MYIYHSHFEIGRSRVVLGIFVMMMMVVGCRGGEQSNGFDGTSTADQTGQMRTGKFALLEYGLEYQRYVIAGDRDVLIRELGRYAIVQPDPNNEKDLSSLSSAQRASYARLEENGLRLFLIPIKDVGEVLRGLETEPVHDTTWLGMISNWTPVAAGPRVLGTRILSVDGQQESYNEGQFRLLVRSYPVHAGGVGSGRVLQLELLPQWNHAQPRSSFEIVDPQARVLSGKLYTEMAGAVGLDGSFALLVLGDDPSDVWVDDQEAEGDSSEHLSVDELNKGEDLRGEEQPRLLNEDLEFGLTHGPKALRIKTIGEEVLNSCLDSKQMILIFIPHLEGG